MKSQMTCVLAICCGPIVTASALAADRIEPGLYQAAHRLAEFEIRITDDGAMARGRDSAASSYSSWKTVKIKDKGSRLRYKSLGYNLKVNKSAIQSASFKGHLTAVGVNFGLLTFHRQ